MSSLHAPRRVNAIFGFCIKLPLLELPDVILIKILRKLDVVSIVKLSFLSQKMKRVIRSVNYPLKSLVLYAVEPKSELVRFYGPSMLEINLGTRIQLVDRLPKDKRLVEVIGGIGLAWGNFFQLDLPFIRPPGADRKSLEDLIFRYFLELFRKIDILGVTLDSGKLKELDMWNVTKSIDFLHYNCRRLKRIPVEEMKFILEEIDVKKQLKIVPKVEEGFRHSTGFKMNRVDILNDASWVDLDAVINSNSYYITFESYREITKRQINNLLKLWISGERMKNLTSFSIKKCAIIGEEDVFEGIQMQLDKPGTVKRSDGKMARIQVKDKSFEIWVPKK